MRHLDPRDPSVGRRRKLIPVAPAPGIAVAEDADLATLERLPQGSAVAEVLDAERVEIVDAAIDRQIPAPVIGIAAQGDGAARLKPIDHVGTRAGDRRQRRVVERATFPFRLLQNRPQRHDQRRLSIRLSEGEFHAALTHRLHRGDGFH